MQTSKNATVNRHLFLQNNKCLIDFSSENAFDGVSLGEGLSHVEPCPLPPDIVSEGKTALLAHAAELPDGEAAHKMVFTYTFDEVLDLSERPTLTFAFSAYGGERDSQYFANVKENMYFVEKPDPLLVSDSYLTVTLLSDLGQTSSTAKLTDYGFNRIFMNFSGQRAVSAVKGIRFCYEICERAEGWQRMIKLDTVRCGMEVDLNLHGCGMEKLFGSKNAMLKHENGVLSAACEAGACIELPDLTGAENTVCDIFVPIKNTLLLRMDADCDDITLTVSLRTEDDTEQRADNVKTFALTSMLGGRTLLLNLSDLPAAQGVYTDKKRLVHMSLRVAEKCKINIYKIAFEQEKPIRKTCGRFISCLADVENKTVELECELNELAERGRLRIFDGYLDVVDDTPETLSRLECVAECDVNGKGRIHLTCPLYRGKVSRICSQFIGVLELSDGEWLPFEDRTVIQNHTELCEGNPYAFTLPDKDYDVCDFGACGDGYTDDTAAIQAALDECAKTGGRVILGDTDGGEYGRRYVVTNLRMHSNTELYIAKNAVLWQCDDATLYKTPLGFGHNVSMTGVNWPAYHSSGNYPLIYAFREEYIKITGGGTVRMADIGSRSRDGLFKFIGDNVCIGCKDRIHVVPIGLIECENTEISDIKIIRSSAPYIIVNTSRRLYVGNVILDEAKCTGADGLWPCGSDGVVFERIMMNTNDDGICLSANYNDPRDMLWYYAYPGWDHGTHNVVLRHSRLSCYTFTASAISFCIWGTDAPDLSRVQVDGIELYDTCLEGRLSIGGWTDNPYYGVTPFDGTELDDFSPVNNVRVFNCELRSPTGIDNLRITDLDSDCGLHSPSQFEYGDFKRRAAEQNEGWVTGLSNWSYSEPEAVRQIELYGTQCVTLRKLRGKRCNVWQGLYQRSGKHKMTFDYKCSGEFYAVAWDKNGNEICKKSFYQTPNGYSKGKEWQHGELELALESDDLYRFGIEAADSTVAVYATAFRMDQ